MKVVVFRGDAVETEVRLKSGTTKVGRDARNDVVLDDPQKGVSRFHCEIRAERGRYVISDLKSRNGVHVSGKRIKGSTELSLGLPVIVGPFELVLEDDAASGDYDPASGNPPTEISGPPGSASSTAKPGQSARRAGGAAALPAWLQSRQTQMWGAAALGVLILSGLTWAIVRNLTRPTGVDPVVVAEAKPIETLVDPPPPAVNPNQQQIDELLVAARNAVASKDHLGALDAIRKLRELDPNNTEAPTLEEEANRLAQEAAKNLRPVEPSPIRVPVPPKPTIVEVIGIPARAGEDNQTYQIRANRIQREFAEGNAALAKNEFHTALLHFQNVQREEPKYQNVDLLIAQTTDRQSVEVTKAMERGGQHEGRGNLKEARGWYQTATILNPLDTMAADRLAAVRKRISETVAPWLVRAGAISKMRDKAPAIKYYEDVLNLTEPSDPEYQEAQKAQEALK